MVFLFLVKYFFSFVVLYQPVTFCHFSISYAMDWEPSHGRIRVMLGRSGKVICTLKVDPVSSSGRGDVQVVRVEGSSHQTEIERLQVKFCLLSLVNCERVCLEPSTLSRVYYFGTMPFSRECDPHALNTVFNG